MVAKDGCGKMRPKNGGGWQTLQRTKVEKIINLRIIYCGLEFMVHSSFCAGMNRKHSFITIFGTQHVFEAKDLNATAQGMA